MAATPKVTWVQEDESLPDLPRAAHLAMLVLKAAGCNSWKVLTESPEAQKRVRVTPEQQALLDTYDYVIQFLQHTPMRTINYCPECHRWLIVHKNPPAKSAKCKLTTGCPGICVRVIRTAAKAVSA